MDHLIFRVEAESGPGSSTSVLTAVDGRSRHVPFAVAEWFIQQLLLVDELEIVNQVGSVVVELDLGVMSRDFLLVTALW
jgi:hypothetical protein